MTSFLRRIRFGTTAADNAKAIHAGAEVKGAPYPDATKTWLAFIHSPEAPHVLARYGFKPNIRY